MGRAKTKAKQKSNVPISFPHDGPLFHLTTRDIRDKDEHERNNSIQLAIKILHATSDVGDIDGLSGVFLLVVKLFQVLRRPNTTTKEQLQALQTFKCTFINLEKKILDGDQLLCDEDWEIVGGLYRLLLEWSLSYQTPLPFQRAIQANLKMLGSSALSSTIAKSLVNDPETICKDVLESIWSMPENWVDPLNSLDIAVNYAPLREILQNNLMADCLTFLGRSEPIVAVLERQEDKSSLSSQVIDNALRIVTMLKVLFGNLGTNIEIPPAIPLFENFVFALLTYPKLPSDGFNTLGILYGKILFMNVDSKINTMAKVRKSVCTLEELDSLSPLARLSMVQGIAATLDTDSLISSEEGSPLILCWEYSLRVGQTSIDPMVRWAAIKGLSTLASRWQQHKSKIGNSSYQSSQRPLEHTVLVKKTVDLVFDSWENPPLRKLGMAIPGLFKALVQLLPPTDLRGLCHQVLEQPVSRKGRYLALEILLPYMPATRNNENSNTPSSSDMIPVESLLEGIGDRGANAGSIANLWVKVLKRAWEGLSLQNGIVDVFQSHVFETWQSYWMPSFCRAILDPSLTRRKQVVAFCLPRIADLMKEFTSLRNQLPLLFVGLLNGIEAISAESTESNKLGLVSDRILWAELEITRYSSEMKISDKALDAIIASCLHREKFQCALVHSLPFIRLVAFRAMKSVIASYGTTSTLEKEAEMWRYALPYSIKTNESKEYLSNLLQCLSNFLDRLSAWEAGLNSASESKSLPMLQSFIIEYLIDDVILTKGSYSGTIADKEMFGVSLMGCLLAFSLQDESYGSDNTILKKNAVFNRKRSLLEQIAMREILKALVQRDILSSLFGLLHSIWDNTREVAFQYLTKLAVASQSRKLAIAKEYHDENQRQFIFARGIYLASSPRQRESDTGARMICFLYASLSDQSGKDSFLTRLVSLSRERVSSMKSTLNNIILGQTTSSDGSCLPLAHGMIHAIRLCIDHDKSARRLLSIKSSRSNIYFNESMIEVFCKAIQLSLSVVADVRDGEAIDGIDEETVLVTSKTKESDSTPLNVNTGAIGANGTFSSVSTTNLEETKARLAVQRVVVGSWLLTKETCAAISSVINIEGYIARYSLVSKVGQLLISTLTTLKHAGAAFAARDALQQIALNCQNLKNPPDIRSLPRAWSYRLVDEISLNEKVRNSTLRRSTGYALGFLAIFRADVSNKSASYVISKPLLERLLMLSLPPEKRIEDSLAKLKIFQNEAEKSKIFVFASNSSSKRPYILDSQYESRCRVHALNILRMIILDAPLSSLISPFVGDAIISAILGYDDPSWAIRNSSTMVFAAAMLRVIDPDKNASNSDKTSSNAITLTELIRRYPPLATFIPSVLRMCLHEMECQGKIKSEMFPILLMLSRVQPVTDSVTTISQEFVPLLSRCLGSKDYGIRHVAARSLANLSSPNISDTLLSDCKQALMQLSRNDKRDWNFIDGTLFLMDSMELSSNKKILDIETQRTFIRIAKSIQVPPSCRSTVLQILASSNFVDSAELCCACDMIVNNDSIITVVGGSFLYKTASEALCLLLQQNLWRAKSESILENSLSELKRIFVNDIIDARLHAIKRFKKDIYENLDLISALKTNETAQLPSMTILNGLASMLLDCVASELSRGIANPTGSHIPTLRRLSRCLLETLHVIDKSALLPMEYDQLWSISHEIVEREHSFLTQEHSSNSKYLNSNGGNVLSGNAVEMMAIAIALNCEDLVAKGNEQETGQIYERMNILLEVVSSLNDPDGSWRTRQSAALALETCCNILVSYEDIANLETLRREIMIIVLEMLQDSDPDVRTVAARAATKLNARIMEQHDKSCSNIRLLPEWTLERTFPLTFAVDSSVARHKTQQSSTIKLLQAMILNHCHDLIDDIQNLKYEFGFTKKCLEQHHGGKDDDLKALVNANTTRKIFEDEDPNPFQEKILLNQLAIQSILSLTSTSHQSSSNFGFLLPDNTSDVLAMCDSVLMRLLETQNDGAIVHEISRYPTVFPSLHSILCASIMALYLMRINNMCVETGDCHQSRQLEKLRDKICMSVEKLMSMDKTHPTLHPSILLALKLLSHFDRDKHSDNNQPNKSDVEKLLFLLNK